MSLARKIFKTFAFLFLLSLFILASYGFFYAGTAVYISSSDDEIVSTDYKQYGIVKSISLNDCSVGKYSLRCSFSTDTHNFTNTDVTRYPDKSIDVGDKLFNKNVNYHYMSKFNKCKNNWCLSSGFKTYPTKFYSANINNISFLLIAIIYTLFTGYIAIHFAIRLAFNWYHYNEKSVVDIWSDTGLFSPRFYLKCLSCETAFSDNIAVEIDKKNKKCPCCDTTVNPKLLNGVGIYKVPANNVFTRFFKIPNYAIKEVK